MKREALTKMAILIRTFPRTFDFRPDQVQHLAEAVLEGQGLDGHGLQLLALLFIEVLQLVHGQHPVPIHIHAAEPVLYATQAGESREERGLSYIRLEPIQAVAF